MIEALVIKQIRGILPKIRRTDPLFDDLLQESKLAVWRATIRFDRRINPNFATYAMVGVRNAVVDAISNEVRATRGQTQLSQYERDFDGIDEVEELLHSQVDTANLWSWLPAVDAELMYKEIKSLLVTKLTGTSFAIYLFKAVGKTDVEIRRLLELRVKDYSIKLKVFKWRVAYILKEAGYNLSLGA